MKVINSYASAWKAILKYRSPIIFIFLVNIAFTYIVTSPFTIYFRNKFQNSLLLENYDGFDISSIMEFVTNYGMGLEPLGVVFWLLLISFFLFGVFVNSCLLYSVISKNRLIALRAFLNGGLNYFWKMLRLSLYFLLALGITLILLWNILLAIGINVLEVESDREIMNKMKWGLAFCGLIFAYLSIVKQYTKIFIAIDQKPFISASIIKSGSFALSKFLNTIGLYLMNIAGLLLVLVLYYTLRNAISVNAWILLFILAQLLLLLKIVIRIVHLDSSYKLYQSYIVEDKG